MYQIDMEKFGSFVYSLRREKGLTQKELGERLFVSDKTVSKWERGQSIPNISLLIPISEILDVTVTELLKGERLNKDTLSIEEIEELVAGSVNLSAQEQKVIWENKRKWRKAYFLCLVIAIVEITIIGVISGSAIFDNTPMLTITGLAILFSTWFCLFSKDVLPTYYDEHKINFVSDGIFRMNMPGVHFNNSNWPHILNAARIYLLGLGVVSPILYYLIWQLMELEQANLVTSLGTNLVTLPLLLGLLVVVYIVAKKYE